MSAAPFANGIVPQPVAYTRPGEEVDLSIDNELPARATIVLQNNQILHLQCVQVILTLIKRWDIDIPLTAIEHVTLSAEERQIGGLGIYMVKKSVDEMAYRREGDSNVLTICKRL